MKFVREIARPIVGNNREIAQYRNHQLFLWVNPEKRGSADDAAWVFHVTVVYEPAKTVVSRDACLGAL